MVKLQSQPCTNKGFCAPIKPSLLWLLFQQQATNYHQQQPPPPPPPPALPPAAAILQQNQLRDDRTMHLLKRGDERSPNP